MMKSLCILTISCVSFGCCIYPPRNEFILTVDLVELNDDLVYQYFNMDIKAGCSSSTYLDKSKITDLFKNSGVVVMNHVESSGNIDPHKAKELEDLGSNPFKKTHPLDENDSSNVKLNVGFFSENEDSVDCIVLYDYSYENRDMHGIEMRINMYVDKSLVCCDKSEKDGSVSCFILSLKRVR
jgi:hypothetical protein